jgi:hypothetical protein
VKPKSDLSLKSVVASEDLHREVVAVQELTVVAAEMVEEVLMLELKEIKLFLISSIKVIPLLMIWKAFHLKSKIDLIFSSKGLPKRQLIVLVCRLSSW